MTDTNEPPKKSIFWAKTGKTQDNDFTYHALLCHLLDVGAVAEQLLTWGPENLRGWAHSMFPQTDSQNATKLLAALIALHDIGKLSPGFQQKAESFRDLLGTLGFRFDIGAEDNHGKVSLAVLEPLVGRLLDIDRITAQMVADSIAGHHGSFLSSHSRNAIGDGRWHEERLNMVQRVLDAFGVSSEGSAYVTAPLTASALSVLAGLVSVVDWIGSDEHYFAFHESEPSNSDAYLEERRKIARERLQAYSFIRESLRATNTNFQTLFGAKLPHALQESLINRVSSAQRPFLAVVETPTGSGKTEAVLGAYAKLCENGVPGFYYALPTKTTGNQMFKRVKAFLDRLFSDSQVELHLLHGEASFVPEYEAMRLAGIHSDDNDPVLGSVRATSWFAGRKRGLLSDHAVGTVDQAMMAVLQVKHFFVRLFGLSDKLVVLDEVHAYDSYMSEVIERLVEWLRAIGASVVLLSATLPTAKKARLIEAFRSTNAGETDDDFALYPSLTVVDSSGNLDQVSVSAPAQSTLGLRLLSCNPDERTHRLATAALAAVEGGGCIGVIANTVDEAQGIFVQLRDQCDKNVELFLLHARLTRARRQSVEAELSRLLGPGSQTQRPQRAIVVSTQVIEQSVDFDFDRLITDLAPIDLLLQRAGRLHRHSETARPTMHDNPVIEITVPEDNTAMHFGKSEYVYEPVVLARSMLVLQEMEHSAGNIRVPEDVRDAIEDVYAESETAGIEARLGINLTESIDRALGNQLAERFQALVASLPSIRTADLPEKLSGLSRMDDGEARAVTRLDADSVTLIVIEDEAALDQELSTAVVRLFLDRAVPLSNKWWVMHFRELENREGNAYRPEPWRTHWYLRFAHPVVFKDGVYQTDEGTLQYNEALGLQFATKPQTARQ